MSWNEIKLMDRETAERLRAFIEEPHAADGEALAEEGIFGPIALENATGRARCRVCGQKIPAHASCVGFQLDMYIKRFGRWGHAVKAYAHWPGCPNGEEE